VLDRVPDARPRAVAAIPIGFDENDVDALERAPRPNCCFDEHDGFVHLCYVGTVLPKGGEVIEAVLGALAALRRQSPEAAGRLRLHFIGTSNQRNGDTRPRVLPMADSLGVEDLVTEMPLRLDYLDALNVQMRAHALLLLGSSEPHYTPSKVFPALLARKPILAAYHSASSVFEVLDASGVDATTFRFDERKRASTLVNDIVPVLSEFAHGRRSQMRSRSAHAQSAWSARTLAGQLAGVLDRVAVAS